MALPNLSVTNLSVTDKKSRISQDQILKLTQDMVKILGLIAESSDISVDEQESIEEATTKTAKIEGAMLHIEKLKIAKNLIQFLWRRKIHKALIVREKQKFNMIIRQAASLSHMEKSLTGFSKGLQGLPTALDENAASLGSQFTDFAMSMAGGFGLMRKAGETAAKWTKGGFDKLVGLGRKSADRIEKVKLKAIEKDREDQRFDQKMLAAILGLKGKKEGDEKSVWGKLFQAAAVLGLFLTSWFAGLFTELDNQLLALRAWIKQTWVVGLIERLKNIQKLGIGGLVTKILAPFEKIILWIKGKWLKATGGISTMWAKFTATLTKWFPKLSKIIKPILGIAPKLLGLLAKIAWPLTILLLAWEAVKGFMKGWEKYATGGFWDGLWGGIIGAFEGVLKFFTDDILNLLKDVVSWLLKKFGFGETSKKLDAFNFNISGIVSGWLISAVNWIYGLFGLTPLGVPAEGAFPEDADWTIMGILNSVWQSIKDWFLDLIGWSTIRGNLHGEMKKRKVKSIGDLVMDVVEDIGKWFTEFLSFDFGKVKEWFLSLMPEATRGWLGDGETPTKGTSPKQTQGLLDKVNSYADKIMNQYQLIQGLQEQVNGLIFERENGLSGGGGATQVNNTVQGGGSVNQFNATGTSVHNSGSSIGGPALSRSGLG